MEMTKNLISNLYDQLVCDHEEMHIEALLEDPARYLGCIHDFLHSIDLFEEFSYSELGHLALEHFEDLENHSDLYTVQDIQVHLVAPLGSMLLEECLERFSEENTLVLLLKDNLIKEHVNWRLAA